MKVFLSIASFCDALVLRCDECREGLQGWENGFQHPKNHCSFSEKFVAQPEFELEERSESQC